MTSTTADAPVGTRGGGGGLPFPHLGRAAGAVARAQLALVTEEAREDTSRVLFGFGLLALGGGLIAFTVLALDVALGVWLALAVGPLAAALLVAAIDAALALLLFVYARLLLRRPVMARTRAVIKLTALELRKL